MALRQSKIPQDTVTVCHADGIVLSALEKHEVLILCASVKHIHSRRWKMKQSRSKGLGSKEPRVTSVRLLGGSLVQSMLESPL